jgi:hypothetical protein
MSCQRNLGSLRVREHGLGGVALFPLAYGDEAL